MQFKMLLSFDQAIHSVSMEFSFFFFFVFSLNNRSWTFFLLADVYVLSSLFVHAFYLDPNLFLVGKHKAMCWNFHVLLPISYFAGNGIDCLEVRDI